MYVTNVFLPQDTELIDAQEGEICSYGKVTVVTVKLKMAYHGNAYGRGSTDFILDSYTVSVEMKNCNANGTSICYI